MEKPASSSSLFIHFTIEPKKTTCEFYVVFSSERPASNGITNTSTDGGSTATHSKAQLKFMGLNGLDRTYKASPPRAPCSDNKITPPSL